LEVTKTKKNSMYLIVKQFIRYNVNYIVKVS
jgi:hypothetical protein